MPDRQSFRFRGYDYRERGGYFVTICSHQKKSLFGAVQGQRVELNASGEIVREELLRTPQVRPTVHLDCFVIMPNHVHAIIVLYWPLTAAPSAQPKPARTLSAGSLGAIIGQFKSVTTKRINEALGSAAVQIWQRNYFEHIIRTPKAWGQIQEYIQVNPVMWATDRENPSRQRNQPDQIESIIAADRP